MSQPAGVNLKRQLPVEFEMKTKLTRSSPTAPCARTSQTSKKPLWQQAPCQVCLNKYARSLYCIKGSSRSCPKAKQQSKPDRFADLQHRLGHNSVACIPPVVWCGGVIVLPRVVKRGDTSCHFKAAQQGGQPPRDAPGGPLPRPPPPS